jgi:hypothetical protein
VWAWWKLNNKLDDFEVTNMALDMAQRIPIDPRLKPKIINSTQQIIVKYLSNLEDREDRFPHDIAISALFCSCNSNGVKLSEYDIEKLTGYDLPGWSSVAEDIVNRLRMNHNGKH